MSHTGSPKHQKTFQTIPLVRAMLRLLIATSVAFLCLHSLPIAQTETNTRTNPWRLPNDPLLGFIEIPAGTFTMGADSEELQADDDNWSRHAVTLPTYFISTYEVTVVQFAAFVEDAGYQADRRSLEGLADHPVTNVSWNDAMAYCAWLTIKLHDWTGTPSVLAHRLRGNDGGSRWQVTLPS